MKLNKLIIILILFTLSSCFTQSPAPIEYNGETSFKTEGKANTIKYNNMTEQALPEEEPIYSLKFKTAGNLETVIFKEGDSLSQIAADYTVSEKALILANRLNSEQDVHIGQKLIIPQIVIHEVKNHEDLHLIAQNYKQDLALLAELNNIKYPYKITEGDVLEIIVEPDLRIEQNKFVARNIERSETIKEPKIVTLIPQTALKFIMPVEGVVSQKFRMGKGIENEGIVINAVHKSPVKAIGDGIVTYSGNKPETFGNFIIIKHPGNIFSAYAHLNDLTVNKNQVIKKGDIIGHVGKTGKATQAKTQAKTEAKTEAKLYFALKIDNKPVDPMLHINK